MDHPEPSHKEAASLQRILGILGTALKNTTVGSAKFLLYLISALAILNIIGLDNINYLSLSPPLLIFIKTMALSPIIQKVVTQLGGNLLASRIENIAREKSLSSEQVLHLMENQITEEQLFETLENALIEVNLLSKKEFFSFAATQKRDMQYQTAMLERLFQQVIVSPRKTEVPYQLPSLMAIDNFVGREKEVELLTTQLQSGGIIIVSGLAGVGKSALVAKVLWQIHQSANLQSRFPDGVVYYDLSLQSEITIASSTIAQSFGLSKIEDPNVLIKIFNEKRALIFFDNVENTAHLESLLSNNLTCCIIITSIRQLDVDAIHIKLDELSIIQGEKLLRQLLNDSTSTLNVSELIEELGGNPLAITLAGKYILKYSVRIDDYLNWLKQSLKALELDDGRHRSIPLVIQQNVNAVSNIAKHVLIVFGNHALTPLTDVTFVAALNPLYQYSQAEIRHTLHELIDHSLVQIEYIEFSDGHYFGLYKLKHNLIHRYIREYASNEWPEDWNKILSRVGKTLILGPLELFLNEPSIGKEFLMGGNSLYFHAVILQDNLIREKRWPEASHCTEVLIQCCQSGIGNSQDFTSVLKNGITIAIELDDKLAHAKLLLQLSHLNLTLDNLDEAESGLNQVLNLSKEVNNKEVEANALETMSLVHFERNNPNAAFKLQQEAYSIALKIESKQVQCQVIGDLGVALIRFGQPHQAIPLLENAASIAEQEKYLSLLAYILFNLGNAFFQLGQPNDAIAQYNESIIYAKKKKLVDLELGALRRLGSIYQSIGEIEKVIENCKETLKIARMQNDQLAIAVDLGNLGIVYKKIGDKKSAIGCLEEALEIFEVANSDYTQITRERLEQLRAAE